MIRILIQYCNKDLICKVQCQNADVSGVLNIFWFKHNCTVIKTILILHILPRDLIKLAKHWTFSYRHLLHRNTGSPCRVWTDTGSHETLNPLTSIRIVFFICHVKKSNRCIKKLYNYNWWLVLVIFKVARVFEWPIAVCFYWVSVVNSWTCTTLGRLNLFQPILVFMYIFYESRGTKVAEIHLCLLEGCGHN